MTRATFFTDNCSKQCATSFGFIDDCGVYDVYERRRRVHVEAHYYGVCHGKSLSGSERGVAKTFAKNQDVSGRMRILGSYDLYQKLKVSFDFELREVSMTESG